MTLKDEALQGMDIEEFITQNEEVAYALFYPKKDVDNAVVELKKRINNLAHDFGSAPSTMHFQDRVIEIIDEVLGIE